MNRGTDRIGARNERPWGAWTLLEAGSGYRVKRIEVLPGKRLSLQKHAHRSEHWVVVEGMARVTNDSRVYVLKRNQWTFIALGAVHRLENPDSNPLVVIEVQSGDDLRETDIVRLEDDFGRCDRGERIAEGRAVKSEIRNPKSEIFPQSSTLDSQPSTLRRFTERST